MKKSWTWVLAWALTFALGAGWHFCYELLPSPIVGLFAPVDESVWEHLKLLFWPFLIAAAILTRRMPNRQGAWGGFLLALLVMPAAMLGAHYAIRDGFGCTAMFWDIAIYGVVLALGFWIAARENRLPTRVIGTLVLLCSLWAACLMLFSFAAPSLPIFLPPQQ